MSDHLNSNSPQTDSDISFTKAVEESIQRIEKAQTKDFLSLAKTAGLDPKKDFSGGDLNGVDLSGLDLSHFDLSHANLSHANLSYANLLSADFRNADVASITVEKARLGWNLGLSEAEQINLAYRGARLEERIQDVLSIWEEFEPGDRDWIIAHGDNRFLPSGEVLIHQGKAIDTIYIVLDGKIDVLDKTAITNRKIATIERNEMVGEMSFVKERVPSVTLVAKENTLLWSIPRVKLTEKLAQDSEFGYRFYRAISAVLAHRLRETTQKLLDERSVNEDNVDSSTSSLSQARAKLAIGGMLEPVKAC